MFLLLHWGYLSLANARDREIEQAWALYGEKQKWETNDYPAHLSDQLQEVNWDETEILAEKPKRCG